MHGKIDAGTTVGQRLRAAREQRGLSIEEAADRSRVGASFLRALEGDDYRLLPDELYLVGFLRDYARFLGLDPRGLDTDFRNQIRRPPLPLTAAPAARGPARRRRGGRRISPDLLIVGGALLLLVPGFFILLSLLSRWTDQPPPPVVVRPAAPPAAVPAARPMPPAQPPPREEPAAASDNRLVIRARELTWLTIRVDRGPVREMLLRAGEAEQWTGTTFRMTIGNAGGIQVLLNGNPLPPLGAHGQVIRNLVLPREAAPPL